MGYIRVMNIMIMDEVNMFITLIWSCTNFLVPKTNG
jgi:hypothetical protein